MAGNQRRDALTHVLAVAPHWRSAPQPALSFDISKTDLKYVAPITLEDPATSRRDARAPPIAGLKTAKLV